MDTFQIIVLSVACVVLIAILIVVGMLMKKEAAASPFPPVSTDCPDSWTSAPGGMCIPDISNSGVFKGVDTSANFITKLKENDKGFTKYTPGYAFCKANHSGATDGSCNTSDAQTNLECKRCLSLPSGNRDINNGVIMTDELWAAGGKSARCAKKDWANRFGFTWDGVSNYNSC